MHRLFRQRNMNPLKATSAIGFLVALLMLSGCAREGAAAGSTAARSVVPATTAATRAIAARPPATSAGPATGMTILHTVQDGENLYRIARKYGTSVQAIQQANGIADSALITTGQKLIIPNLQATTEPEPTATPTNTPTPVPATPTASATPLVHTATPKGPAATIDPNATPTLTPTPSPTPLPPDNVNGVKLDQIVIMPPAVQENVKQIFAKGQQLGNTAQRFSKIGDSIIEQPHYMVKFDTPDYNLGQYAYLQDVLDYYRGSYGRDSLSVRRGLHSWSWNNPTWADKDQCQPDEGPVACEYRVYKPSVSLIVLGSNDVGVPDYFRKSMEQLVQFTIDQGVIPIIVTKADRHEGDSNVNNTILKETAAKFNVPLLDFDAVAGTMPNRGIDPADGTHLTFYYAHDYSVPAAFTKGHAVHDLTSVIMLDKLWRLLGLKP
jgi:LysM repeat protein